jgi:hypothetical protein
VPLPQWKEVEGVKTLFAEKHDTPLVTFFLAFPGGAYFDPPGKNGRADTFTSLLLRGTKNRTRDQIETALDELKTHLRGSKIILRSKTPDLVRQECYGLLLAHYAIRGLMHEAALTVDVDPDRLSFLHAVRVVRRKLQSPGAFPPSGHRDVS